VARALHACALVAEPLKHFPGLLVLALIDGLYSGTEIFQHCAVSRCVAAEVFTPVQLLLFHGKRSEREREGDLCVCAGGSQLHDHRNGVTRPAFNQMLANSIRLEASSVLLGRT
jgi:hypothetical protein